MAYKVFLAQTFKEKLEKAGKPFQIWFDKILDQLAKNPRVGKPLGTTWFREKKFEKRRVYFLVYEDLNSVFVVNLSEKKDQQAIINSVKLLLGVYKNQIQALLQNSPNEPL